MTRRKFQGAKRSDLPATKPSERVTGATTAELRLESLLRKLNAWLMQQPDWVFLLAQDRRTRRQVGTAVADLLTRIPQRSAPSGLAPGQVIDIKRVGTGDKEAKSQPSVQGSLEDVPGPTLHTPADHEAVFDPEGEAKAQFEAANEAYMDRLEEEQRIDELNLAELGGEG